MATVELGYTSCWCGTPFALPMEMLNAARNAGHTVYCPHGHTVCWKETEIDRVRRERDRLKQNLAEKDDEIRRQQSLREGTERQLAAQRGVVTRIKNRVGHGVCPCCSRTFQDLQRHMKTKHSDYAKSELQAAE